MAQDKTASCFKYQFIFRFLGCIWLVWFDGMLLVLLFVVFIIQISVRTGFHLLGIPWVSFHVHRLLVSPFFYLFGFSDYSSRPWFGVRFSTIKIDDMWSCSLMLGQWQCFLLLKYFDVPYFFQWSFCWFDRRKFRRIFSMGFRGYLGFPNWFLFCRGEMFLIFLWELNIILVISLSCR